MKHMLKNIYDIQDLVDGSRLINDDQFIDFVMLQFSETLLLEEALTFTPK